MCSIMTQVSVATFPEKSQAVHSLAFYATKDNKMKIFEIMTLKQLIDQFWKYASLLSCQELDEKIDISITSVCSVWDCSQETVSLA